MRNNVVFILTIFVSSLSLMGQNMGSAPKLDLGSTTLEYTWQPIISMPWITYGSDFGGVGLCHRNAPELLGRLSCCARSGRTPSLASSLGIDRFRNWHACPGGARCARAWTSRPIGRPSEEALSHQR